MEQVQLVAGRDPIWRRGFTYIYNVILENASRLKLTSVQVRLLLVLVLLRFRKRRTTYREIASLLGVSPDTVRKHIRSMELRGLLKVNRSGKRHVISLEPYERLALKLARAEGQAGQTEGSGDVEIALSVGGLHFTKLPALLLEEPLGLSHTEIHLLLAFSYFTWGFSSLGHAKRIVNLTYGQISELMGVSKETVRRTLASLERKGYALRVQRPGLPHVIDLSPLWRALEIEPKREVEYSEEDLEFLKKRTRFKEVDLEPLIKRWGFQRVAWGVDYLAWVYRRSPSRLRDPRAALVSLLRGNFIADDPTFVPLPERKRIAAERRRVAMEEKRRQEEELKRENEAAERGEKIWRELPQEERERIFKQYAENSEFKDLLALGDIGKRLLLRAIFIDLGLNDGGSRAE